MNDLARKEVPALRGRASAPLTDAQVGPLLKGLSGWAREGKAISKTYEFSNYHETMAFVNATAWISHREDHHPDLAVGYGQCKVSYWTHAIGGLSGERLPSAPPDRRAVRSLGEAP